MEVLIFLERAIATNISLPFLRTSPGYDTSVRDETALPVMILRRERCVRGGPIMSLHGLCKTNPVGGRLGLERRLGTLLYDFMTLHNLSSLLDSFDAD